MLSAESRHIDASAGRTRDIVWHVVRRSPIHGFGVYARRNIPAGTRIIEYRGRRISNDEADRLWGDMHQDDVIVFFALDNGRVIDARRDGNDARFINHSCEPNCEAVEINNRVFIEALRDIRRGEELFYTYNLQVTGRRTAEERKRFECRCGATRCRGTMAERRSRK